MGTFLIILGILLICGFRVRSEDAVTVRIILLVWLGGSFSLIILGALIFVGVIGSGG